MPFQVMALPAEPFEHLFGQGDDTLRAHGARRITVDHHPGFPCRISLEDAAIGETVLLLNYEHQPVMSPYRSSHAIFVREGAVQARLRPDDVPDQLRRRLLSIRAFDAEGMIIDADVVDGRDFERIANHMLTNWSTSYLHVHNARQGCYAARVDRSPRHDHRGNPGATIAVC